MVNRYNDPLIIGVTGGIGSGQSTVCSFLESWGCKVINADRKAKEVIARDKELQQELKNEFGKDVFLPNGQLNAQRLAELAFKDEMHTHKLNQFVHPRMVASLIDEMEEARFSRKYLIVVIDAALIYEISIERMFDGVIVVNASFNERQSRVCQRDGMSKKQFKERVDKQIPLEEKVKWADHVIENEGSIEELRAKTRVVFDQLVGSKGSRPPHHPRRSSEERHV